MRSVFAIATADALERMRRFPFLVILALAVYAGYIYIPDAHAAYSTIDFNGHRGFYDSAYLGAAVTVLDVLVLSLFGFFFVRGSVERDYELHVDGAVAASAVKKAQFLLGKWLSNVAVLAVVTAVTYLATIVMQEWHGEDRTLHILDYVVPYVAITLPAVAVIAAIALVFDCIGFLRGILGGIVYVLFIGVNLSLIPFQLSHDFSADVAIDPMGMTPVISQLNSASLHDYPRDRGKRDISIGGNEAPRGGFTIYRFPSMRWTAALFAERASWILASMMLVVLCAPLFDRFRRNGVRRNRGPSRINLAAVIPNLPGLRLILAETALLVSGVPLWWLIGAAALLIAQTAMPLENVTDFVLPIALIWPLERISMLGARERLFATQAILRATPGYAWRTAAVQWSAATVLQALLVGGFLLRLIVTGQITTALALFVALGAVAGIALLFGTLTGAARTFQALYLLAWYIGPIQHLPELDVVKTAATHTMATAIVAGGIAFAAVCGSIALRARERIAS